MLCMFVLNAALAATWSPFGMNLVNNCMAMVEPIIFLSGFLICLRTVPQTRAKFALTKVMGKFALRRIVRTWPMYFLLMGMCLLFPWLSDRPIEQSPLSIFTFTMNYGLDPHSGMVGMWTLCVEEWCYLIFLLLIPWIARGYGAGLFLILAATSLLARMYVIHMYGPFYRPPLYMTHLKFPTWTHMDSFWLGCAFARHYVSRAKPTRLESYLYLFGAFAVASLYFLTVNLEKAYFQLTIPLWGALFTGLLISGLEVIDVKWLRCSGLVHLGWISYSVYLIHKITIERFIEWNRLHQILPSPSFFEIIGAFLFSIAAGTVVYWLIERPILRGLRRPIFQLSFSAPR